MTTYFEEFGATVVQRHDEHLLDYGPEEQAERVVAALRRLNAMSPLTPVTDKDLSLAGFGTVPVRYASTTDVYVLLSDVTEQLGWFHPRAHAWAEMQHSFAIADQRRRDEERGDGRLGWDLMCGFVDLGLCLCVDDPEAKPDGGGRRWSHSGDWLVSQDRLPLLLSCSPWGKEFIDNALPAFGHAMREIHGDKLKAVPTYGPDGEPTGGSAYDDMFSTDGLTKAQAIERARRGLVVDECDGSDQ